MKGKFIRGSRHLLLIMAVVGVVFSSAGIAFGIVLFDRSEWKKVHQMNEVGAELLEEHQYAEAIKVYQEVLHMDSKNADADRGLSDAYLGIARESINEEAISNYRIAIAFNAVNLTAYRELADLYFAQQEYEDAFRVLEDLNKQYSQMLTSDYLVGSIARVDIY